MKILKQFFRDALMKLSPSRRYELFYQSARLLGIRGYLLDGKQGPFVGAVADRAIMRTYLLDREWSTEIRSPIELALRSGGTFIDVGANIGLISLSVAKLPGVKVLALEPDEENHSFLRANIALHGASNVQPLKLAAWHRQEELRFARNSYNSGDHHLAASGDVVVQAVPLDSLDVPPGPLVIKIDTQGAEPAVLKGADALLQRAELIIVEFWPWGMHRMGLQCSEAIDILVQLNRTTRVIKHGEVGEPLAAAALRSLLEKLAARPQEYESIDLMLEARPVV
jgi:FkbM family methyltransferase